LTYQERNDSKVCPYIETRLSIETRVASLEKEVSRLCKEASNYSAILEQNLKQIYDKLEKINDNVINLSNKNSIQDKDITFLQDELRERRNLNRWTADKVVAVLSSILSPILVAVILSKLIK
jgi:septal ring factor EnvC (AmiA/AmiB activator)